MSDVTITPSTYHGDMKMMSPLHNHSHLYLMIASTKPSIGFHAGTLVWDKITIYLSSISLELVFLGLCLTRYKNHVSPLDLGILYYASVLSE